MVMQQYDQQVENLNSDKYIVASKATVKGFLLMAQNLSGLMLEKMMANHEHIQDSMMEINTENVEWYALRPLAYIREITRRALSNHQ